MIKLCIFDLDGTVLDTVHTIAYYGNYALSKHGIAPIEDKEYNYLNICTEEQLLALPMTRLTKFEFKNKLDRYCVQHKQKLSFLTEERDLKNKGAGTSEERGRFSVKALIDGVVMGIGEGGNMRIASAYASWRALDALGVFSQINTSDVCEDISEEL